MDKVMVIVKGELMVDYAYPCMMAERALKDAHDSMLDREYDKAIEHTLEAMAEVKLMLNAIKEMKERAGE
jgi:hypothetical protein